ncbi:MAG: MoaD/ThiS family protein [Leptospiraceae bacterium]|nr:MoaD/ThiS family protein [Leptospiraceae bacterium]
MQITIQTFAGLKDLFGKESNLEFTNSVKLIEVINKLIEKYPESERLISISSFLVGEEIVDKDYLLKENSTLIIYPPVSGG